MTNPSIADNDPPRRSRARRREAMINAIATILGCMALVIMIATVVRVVMIKLWESARVNPEYVQSMYENDHDHRWSGKVKEHPSLLSDASDFRQPEVSPPREITPTASGTSQSSKLKLMGGAPTPPPRSKTSRAKDPRSNNRFAVFLKLQAWSSSSSTPVIPSVFVH